MSRTAGARRSKSLTVACIMAPGFSPLAILRQYGVNQGWSGSLQQYEVAGVGITINIDLKLAIKFS